MKDTPSALAQNKTPKQIDWKEEVLNVESAPDKIVRKKLTEEQIIRLKKEALEAIQMRADVKTVISVFSKVMKTFGLQDIEMTGEGTNIKAVLPVIVKKLSTEMMLGTFDTQALADLQAIMPIIEKYKHLADE